MPQELMLDERELLALFIQRRLKLLLANAHAARAEDEASADEEGTDKR